MTAAVKQAKINESGTNQKRTPAATQKTIKQTGVKSIKEIKRVGNPMHFDFEAVAHETNA